MATRWAKKDLPFLQPPEMKVLMGHTSPRKVLLPRISDR